ncbi:MAG: Hypothetical protein BHV28_05260 [Candidatus Tokpelaia hoelldobleri]|uniref:DUF2497 domain-containing protein n=1 Tax=Candidatus Tokpelaia hoelldobleri TaxID=1902579 RepID=A0A1U9JTQ0_9HYPH|nr:MAG: Hypothetical protein BHV28_05260 [Candidatus Tokpelaia hoelldoblerii]
MVQNSSAMQEPHMDELLASIREIIEENTGVLSTEPEPQNDRPQAAPAFGRSSSTSGADIYGRPRQPVNDTGFSTRANQRDETVPVHDAMSALAARIGLRADNTHVPAAQQQIQVPQQSRPQTAVVRPLRPEIAPVLNEGGPSRPQPQKSPVPDMRKQAAVQQSREVAERELRSGIERSTEQILRPYITQWLDEHFRQLFERILQEEVQRLMQSLRR